MAEVKMPEVNTEEILGTKKSDTLKKNTQLSAKPEKKKQTFLSRAMMGLKSSDGKNVASYIFEDAILPGFQDLVYNTFDTIVETAKSVVRTAVYGENSPQKKSSKKGEFIDYVDFWELQNGSRKSATSSHATVFSIDCFEYATRDDAQNVLYWMQEILEEDGIVKVPQYYEFSGYTAPHTYNSLGWTNLGNSRVRQSRNGRYYLELPRPKQI